MQQGKKPAKTAEKNWNANTTLLVWVWSSEVTIEHTKEALWNLKPELTTMEPY